jgi:hypothetical protein
MRVNLIFFAIVSESATQPNRIIFGRNLKISVLHFSAVFDVSWHAHTLQLQAGVDFEVFPTGVEGPFGIGNASFRSLAQENGEKLPGLES